MIGCSVVTGQYLEGQGDSVSRFITAMIHIVTLLIPMINLLAKFP